jgi:hypothetical protein
MEAAPLPLGMSEVKTCIVCRRSNDGPSIHRKCICKYFYPIFKKIKQEHNIKILAYVNDMV